MISQETKEPAKPWVRISLDVDSRRLSVFALPLKKFNYILAALLGLVGWGVAASCILVYQALNDDDYIQSTLEDEVPATAEKDLPDLSVLPEAAAPVEAPVAPSVARSTAQPAAQPVPAPVIAAAPVAAVPPVAETDAVVPAPEPAVAAVTDPFANSEKTIFTLAGRSMPFNDDLAVTNLVLEQSATGELRLSFILVNHTGELQEGTLWAVAKFSDDSGENKALLVSSAGAQIGDDGAAQQPLVATTFAIRNQKDKVLHLGANTDPKRKLKEIMIGSYLKEQDEQEVILIDNL